MTANDISVQILLVLASGQPMSVNQIAHAMEAPMGVIWQAISGLEQKKFVTHLNGRVQISREGLAHLQREGFLKSTPASAGSSEKPGAAGVGAVPTVVQTALNKDQVAFIPLIVLFGITMIFCLLSMMAAESRIVLVTMFMVTGLIAIIYIRAAFHSVPEYIRLVIFRLGKCVGVRGPGLVLLIPLIDHVSEVDLRVRHLEVPHEQCITQDNVVIDVDFVLYWQVQQAEWSITRVTNPDESLRLLATALLRAVIAHFPFSEVQTQRERINDMLRQKIDEISTVWGVYVTTVEIREIKPPPEIITSMQLQAAAEWKRQATVTEAVGYREAQIKKAEGDAEALRKLYEVAANIDEKTLRLRYFAMLADLGHTASTKYILPVELIDLVKPFAEKQGVYVASPSAKAPQDGHP
jgi:regulator of protease activity HflC (stomatin/prohibitin superfamily)